MRSAPGFTEFKDGYGKSTKLFLKSYSPEGSAAIYDLILDSTCNEKLINGRFNEIKLRLILGYYCCEHVVYCPFTCRDNNFFKKMEYYEEGRSLHGFPCPFNDGGISDPSKANSTEDIRNVKVA